MAMEILKGVGVPWDLDSGSPWQARMCGKIAVKKDRPVVLSYSPDWLKIHLSYIDDLELLIFLPLPAQRARIMCMCHPC